MSLSHGFNTDFKSYKTDHINLPKLRHYSNLTVYNLDREDGRVLMNPVIIKYKLASVFFITI